MAYLPMEVCLAIVLVFLSMVLRAHDKCFLRCFCFMLLYVVFARCSSRSNNNSKDRWYMN